MQGGSNRCLETTSSYYIRHSTSVQWFLNELCVASDITPAKTRTMCVGNIQFSGGQHLLYTALQGS